MTSDSGRVWLVTGCDSGMGHHIAETALKNGDSVAATILAKGDTGPLSEKYGNRCRYYHLDVRDTAMVKEVVARAERDFGRIDVLMNNAGYGLHGALEETAEDEYRRLFDVNVFGLSEVTRAALPGMRARRAGRIINTASLAGFAGKMGLAFYCASKFAVAGLSEALAAEVGPLGIKVTVIEPGSFRTEFAGTSLAGARDIIDDYADTGGIFRKGIVAKNGLQPNDPAKLGDVIWTLSNIENPPMHLPIGEDSLLELLGKLEATRKDAEQWRELSSSTYFDDVKASA
ncbi:MAG: SDR family NAD(P)-dependent oxidoreductase [Rhodobiaceae bacterium]|nr:SDR family NAD(P)-dependent oxidoreductase [Rhodobiaceae bacterium]MCC0056166.1 SDR family NAD(P)-dependent oxidoreductase [Rhodobiaceae bacterium]